MPSSYTFTEYDPAWPEDFQREATGLRKLMGESLLQVHHIGSTSVPDLAAKPIIDLLPIVERVEVLDPLAGRFEQAGYRAWGEYGIPGRRYFTKDRDGQRTHNLHFFAEGDPAVDRHLAFCAYLRAHAIVRDEYAALKREVYKNHPNDIDGYMDGKNDWIKRTEKTALAWYRSQDPGVS